MVYLLLVLAFALGYLLRDIRDKVTNLYEAFKDRIETPAGVVRPTTKVNQQQSLSSEDEAGGVRPPNPAEYAQIEFNRRNRTRPRA